MADEDNNTALAVRPGSELASIPLTNGVLAPTNVEGIFRLGQWLFKANMVPEGVKSPEQAAIVVAAGMEIGLSPMQSIQNIMIVNNRPSVWGDAALALCSTHKDFEDCIEEDDGETATCTVKRKGRNPVVRAFSKKDANTAGLAGKAIWQKYPARMRQLRARAYGLRDAFPDVLKGVAITEEQRDIDPASDAAPVTRKEAASAVLDAKAPKKTKAEKAPPPPVEEKIIDAEVVTNDEAADPPAKDDVPETQIEPTTGSSEDDEAAIAEQALKDEKPEPKKEPEPAQTPVQMRLRELKADVVTRLGYSEDEGKQAVIAFLAAHERTPKDMEDEEAFKSMKTLLGKKNKTQVNAFIKKYAPTA